MQAEFDAAADEGKALRFAIGCLFASWRVMPSDEQGRFAIANYLLVIGLIVPLAAIMLSGIFLELPPLRHGQVEASGWLPSGALAQPLLTDANQSAVPPLALLVVLLIAAHLRVAWALLERDWARVARVGTLIAASTITLAIFNFVVFVSDTGLVHAAAAAIELSGIFVLVRWHDQLPQEPSSRSGHFDR
jgi:hypothetical protein